MQILICITAMACEATLSRKAIAQSYEPLFGEKKCSDHDQKISEF
jgi:hypothetical protein